MRSLMLGLALVSLPAFGQIVEPPATGQSGRVVGRLAGGPQVIINPDNSLTFFSGSFVLLDDGRKLESKDGKWVLIPETPAGIKNVKPIDLAIYGDDLTGQRIRLQAVRIFSANIQHGLIQIPGTTARVNFEGLPRETLKRLVENCSGIMDRSGCTVTLIATVTGRKVVDGWRELAEPLIETSQAGVSVQRR